MYEDNHSSRKEAAVPAQDGTAQQEQGAAASDSTFDDNAIVTLVDDEGRMSEFEVLDAIETADGRFVALLPLASYNEETGEGDYIILRVVTEGGQEELAEIDDEELIKAAADVFQERFEELYESENV